MATAKFKIESGVQLLARLTKKTEIHNFYPALFENGLNPGDTVEIISNIGTSSYLLIDLICEALLPSKLNVGPLGVLMFNTIGHFKFENLVKSLKNRITCSMNIKLDCEMQNVKEEKMLHKILSNFFLLEIYDATQFYSTIHNLDSTFMKHSNISLLIFDTLTAFYWSEQGFKITKMDLYIKSLLRMIQKVSNEYKVIIVYTKPEYFCSSKEADNFESNAITDCVNFKIQLVDNGAGAYHVNVKTVDSSYKKYFNVANSLIKWQ